MRLIREIEPPPRRTIPPGRWRLLAPALVSWAVVAFLLLNPGSAPWVAGSVLVGAIAIFLGARCWPRLLVVWGLLAVCCAALTLVSSQTALVHAERAASPIAMDAAAHREITIDVQLTAFPEITNGPAGQRGWVNARSTDPRGRVPLLLWLDARAPPDWTPGLLLSIRGTPRALDPSDAAAFGIGVRAFVAPEDSAARGTDLIAGRAAGELRSGLRAAAEMTSDAELVPGLAVGDTSLVSNELDDAMRDSSLSHLTAVSGANCALVTGSVASMSARFGAGRRIRVVVAALALAVFVTVVGPDPSVLRATVMAVVVLVSRFGGRPEAGLPALGIAILALLATDPWQAVQAGFALSVAATGGILLLAGPLTLAARALWLPRPLAVAVAVAAAAQFSCGPFLLLLQSGIPAIGVLANVLAAPAAPVGTALGLLAALVIPIFAPLGLACVWLAVWPARWITMVADVAAALPLARWAWPDGWAGALLLAVAQSAAVLAWLVWSGRITLPGVRLAEPRRPWHPPTPLPRATQLTAAMLVASSIGILVSVTLVTPLAQRAGVPRDWAIVICDVGQGDAILLREPSAPEQVILVDTGADSTLLRACLDRFGVHQIDLLVLTHDDQDHVGALDTVAGVTERALIAPEARDETTSKNPLGDDRDWSDVDVPPPRQVVRQLEAANVPFEIGRAGTTSAPGDEVSWRVLAPEPGVIANSTNAASLVLLAEVGGFRVLLLADTGQPEQSALLRTHPGLRADIFKVSHHGSRDREPGLPERVEARLALVSVGAENRYGHPNSQLLAELARASIPLVRTDEHGSLAVAPGQDGVPVVWVERAEPSVSGRQ